MKQAGRRRALMALLAAPAWLHARTKNSAESLPPIGDLRVIAALISEHKAPLLILFSTPGCPYCREVRRNYLLPRAKQPASGTPPELLLREVDITSSRKIIELTGAEVTEVSFARRNQVQVVPVVALFDPSGLVIAGPLVGLDRSGFYETYLASAIDTARRHLRQTS